MSYTYSTLQNALAAAFVQAPSPYTALPPNFVTLLPRAIEYAEGRIYRDLVLLATRTTDTSLTTTPGNRSLSLATMAQPIIVPEGVALSSVTFSLLFGGQPLTFSGSPLVFGRGVGNAVLYDHAELAVVDAFWPDQTVTMAPGATPWGFWALYNDSTIVLAPTPDNAYSVLVTGLFQPPPISASNPTTYLSTTYPELLLAACMVWLAGGLTRNFGAQSDEPRFAMSWETTYKTMLVSATNEERRRRGLAPNAPPASVAPPQPPQFPAGA